MTGETNLRHAVAQGRAGHWLLRHFIPGTGEGTTGPAFRLVHFPKLAKELSWVIQTLAKHRWTMLASLWEPFYRGHKVDFVSRQRWAYNADKAGISKKHTRLWRVLWFLTC